MTTITGKRLALKADTLCVHGDNPKAVADIGQIKAILAS
ncbi:MAG: LamB/YcsF family protein [Porticoccaceae bacterium]